MTDTQSKTDLLQKAIDGMADDMKNREIGAIIWSIPEAGFHYIPEIYLKEPDGTTRTVRVTGLYLYDCKIYAIEEGVKPAEIENYYRSGIDMPPVVVTLTEDKAKEIFGEPNEKKGFTTQGTLEEWVAIADCYFEALNER